MPSLPDRTPGVTRRDFFGSATAASFAAAVMALPARPAVARTESDGFTYEITRSEEAWRAQLSEQEYFVLRDGHTEVPHTSLNAFQMDDGHYTCKGCGLHNFDSKWKVAHFDIGWAFFTQAKPTTILTSIDEDFSGMNTDKAVIECHCRRCSSHIGHILTVKGKTLHCLNGIALVFHAA